MTSPTKDSDQEIWRGRPWIVPYTGVRTIIVVILVAVTLFLEASYEYLYIPIFGYQVMVWTILVFFVIWIIWIFNLLVLRYTLIHSEGR